MFATLTRHIVHFVLVPFVPEQLFGDILDGSWQHRPRREVGVQGDTEPFKR